MTRLLHDSKSTPVTCEPLPRHDGGMDSMSSYGSIHAKRLDLERRRGQLSAAQACSFHKKDGL